MDKEQSKLIETLQEQVNGSILFKWLVDTVLFINIMESIRRKIVSLINLG